MTIFFVSVQPEPGDDPEVVRAKYFIRDEFLVRKVPKTFHPKTSLYLNLFILIDYLLHIDTICMKLSILYFKRLSVKISLKWRNSVPEDCLYLRKHNCYGHSPPFRWIIQEGLPPYVAFHLGLHCLPKYLFTSIQNEKGYDITAILVNKKFRNVLEMNEVYK